jgi:hypothetical protein
MHFKGIIVSRHHILRSFNYVSNYLFFVYLTTLSSNQNIHRRVNGSHVNLNDVEGIGRSII